MRSQDQVFSRKGLAFSLANPTIRWSCIMWSMAYPCIMISVLQETIFLLQFSIFLRFVNLASLILYVENCWCNLQDRKSLMVPRHNSWGSQDIQNHWWHYACQILGQFWAYLDLFDSLRHRDPFHSCLAAQLLDFESLLL